MKLTPSLAMVLGGLVAFSSLGSPARADIEKKPAPDEKKAPEKKGEPKADAPKVDQDSQLRRIVLRLADWESALGRVSIDGLDVNAFLAPDALVYKCASSYVRFRRAGQSHERAMATLKRLVPRWKRYEKASLLVLRMRNRKYDGQDDEKRVYTLTKNLSKEAIVLRVGKKTRFPMRLAGVPAGLRSTKLRVSKFYTTADGFTRRIQPRRPNDTGINRDPASIGRKPKLSKPVKGVVLEDDEAEVELLLSRKRVQKSKRRSFRVELPNWKVYEGPWEKDIVDLNQSRTWSDVKGLAFDMPLPPTGFRVAPELTKLLGAAQK